MLPESPRPARYRRTTTASLNCLNILPPKCISTGTAYRPGAAPAGAVIPIGMRTQALAGAVARASGASEPRHVPGSTGLQQTS
jgi:hypothetical protein